MKPGRIVYIYRHHFAGNISPKVAWFTLNSPGTYMVTLTYPAYAMDAYDDEIDMFRYQ